MRTYKKKNNLRGVLITGLLLSLLAPRARADFDITLVHSEVADPGVRFTAVVDTALSGATEEVLNRGIGLEVAIDIVLDEHRRIWWDPELGTWTLRRRIQFHALSGQYVVQGSGLVAEGFTSLRDALKKLGQLRDIALSVADPLEKDGDYRLRMRARLDIEALPAPLRPVAYASPSWRLSSGWNKWKVGY